MQVIGWKDTNNKYCDEKFSDNSVLMNEKAMDSVKNKSISAEILQWGLMVMALFIIICAICICIKCVKKFNATHYGRHRATSDGTDGISMIDNPQKYHKNTLSMSDSYVVRMNQTDFVN
eukprot:UN06611